MIDDGFVDVDILRPLGGEVARAVDREVEDGVAGGFGEDRRAVDRAPLDRAAPFLFVEVERGGGQRAVAAGFGDHRPFAVKEIILDRLAALFVRAVGAGIAKNDVIVAEVVEQRAELLLEQRQPMLHPGEATAVRDRLVERIAGGIGAERLAIAGAEPLDAVLVEQSFGGGHQGEGLGRAGGALVGGVEATHRLNLVAEEIEPDRAAFARRVEIDQRAAHREVARIMDRVGALIAIGAEQGDERVAVNPLTLGEAPGELADAERGQHPLGGGIGCGDKELRAVPLDLEQLQSRQSLGHDAQGGRGTVVGQAVPRREGQHLDLGREHRHGLGERTHRGFVGGEDDRAAALRRAIGGAREIGGEPREVARRDRRQRQRFACSQNPGKRVVHLWTLMKSRRVRASIIGPWKRTGTGRVPMPHAMMSTSCSLSSSSNRARSCEPHCWW